MSVSGEMLRPIFNFSFSNGQPMGKHNFLTDLKEFLYLS